MQLGMIGLGRMGANIVRRLMRAGHECVVYDVSADAVAQLAAEGAVGASSLADFAAKLDAPRAAWIMVPAAYAGATATELAGHLAADDVIIDGGNSYYRDDIQRAEELRALGIHYLDVGTSGGVFGLERGYCMMIGGRTRWCGGSTRSSRPWRPAWRRPSARPAASGEPSPAERGYLHCGPAGAGHFVKMVHNGIEYGIMAAYAEGIAILSKADIGAAEQEHDAETTPLRDPWAYRYDIDIAEVAEVWRRGSVISSWLLDLTAIALLEDPALEGFSGRVSDSGEGRWTVLAAVDEGVPAHVLTAALFERFSSRGRPTSPTGCCRPCASSSAATRRRRPSQGGRPERRAGERPSAPHVVEPGSSRSQNSVIWASSRSSKRSRNRCRTPARCVRRAAVGGAGQLGLPAALQLQEEALAVEPPRVPAHGPAGAQDAVAGHDDRDRVRAQRVPRGAPAARASRRDGHLGVGAGLAVRDPGRLAQHGARVAVGDERPVDRDLEVAPAALEVLLQLAPHLVQPRGRLQDAR